MAALKVTLRLDDELMVHDEHGNYLGALELKRVPLGFAVDATDADEEFVGQLLVRAHRSWGRVVLERGA